MYLTCAESAAMGPDRDAPGKNFVAHNGGKTLNWQAFTAFLQMRRKNTSH
jgi:hypothetical protein